MVAFETPWLLNPAQSTGTSPLHRRGQHQPSFPPIGGSRIRRSSSSGTGRRSGDVWHTPFVALQNLTIVLGNRIRLNWREERGNRHHFARSSGGSQAVSIDDG